MLASILREEELELFFDREGFTLKVVPDDKNELGRSGLEHIHLGNKPKLPNSIENISDIHEYNTCFLFLEEALTNEFSHSSKLVLGRVFGPKSKTARI